MRKEFITGGDGLEDAYNQAITEGMIDPNEVSYNDFRAASQHYNVDAQDQTIYDETRDGARNVANLMGTNTNRSKIQQIISRWFGKKD